MSFNTAIEFSAEQFFCGIKVIKGHSLLVIGFNQEHLFKMNSDSIRTKVEEKKALGIQNKLNIKIEANAIVLLRLIIYRLNQLFIGAILYLCYKRECPQIVDILYLKCYHTFI